MHEHNRVQEVYSWDGSSLTHVNISELYPDPIVIEQLKMLILRLMVAPCCNRKALRNFRQALKGSFP